MERITVQEPQIRGPRLALRSGLRSKIIAWSFVPTAIILVAVAIVIFYAYQNVTEDLVIERNRELVRLTADQLAVTLNDYVDLLEAEARTLGLYGQDLEIQRDILRGASNRLATFDAGVLILDTFGSVAAAEPGRPEIMGEDWSGRAYYREILRTQTMGSAQPAFSDIVADGPEGSDVIVVAVPILGPQGEFLGTVAGMFDVGAAGSSTFHGNIVKLHIENSGSAYVVDSRGRVLYHSEASRIGEDLSEQETVQRVSAEQEGAIRTQDISGREIVASFAPVPGTPWGLISEESWSTLISASRGYQRFLLLLLGLGVVVPALVVALAVRRITNPIAELIDAAQEIARGNFGRRITAGTRDELEEMAQQFNLMAEQLQESYTLLERRVADRTKELAALNAIANVVSQSLELDEILDSALDKTLEVMGVSAGGFYLLDEDAGVLTVAAQRGFSARFIAGIDRLRVGEGFSGRVAQLGEPLVIKNVSADPRLTRTVVQEEGLHSVAVVPLSSKGKVMGTMFTAHRGDWEFTDQDVQLLTSIGQQIGVAVENARLYEQAHQLAIVDERQRLARELHDAVTQTLFSASLIAEALPEIWEGDRDEGLDLLAEIRRLSRGALAEMRTLLMELRPAALAEASLDDLLRQLGEAAAGRTGAAVAVTVDETCELPQAAHAAVYRIAQEALNNVVKHAQASHVDVTLRCTPASEGGIDLRVSDDGRGFDADCVPAECLGLGIMQERAEAIGATLTIRSEIDQGTEVRLVCKDTQEQA